MLGPLTVGLPLAAGLDLKSFAGVLAHEFGHFAQGAGMRLYALVMRVNLWFARVVYQRDEWDETLDGWTQDNHGAIVALGYLSKLAVWLTRRVLWVLMQVGRVASGFLSRQMEYDADRYQARMVGAEAFAATHRRVREVGLAENGAYADLRSSWQQRRLPDNFPKLVVANLPQIPPEVLAAFHGASDRARTGLFDTHPADRDRIRRAAAEAPGAGIFHLDGPATDLFRDFDALARDASYALYRSQLGPEISRDQLYAVSELIESQAVALEGHAAADRIFLGALGPTRRLPLPREYPAAPARPGEAKRAFVAARDALRTGRDEALAAARREDELRHRLCQAEVADVLLKAGNTFAPAAFGLDAATPRAAAAARAAARAAAEEGLRQVDRAFEPFATAAADRLVRALSLLELDAAVDRVPDGRDRREEARALYPCVAHLGSHVAPEVARLDGVRQVVAAVVQAYQAGKGEKNPALINAVLRAAARLRDVLEEFRWKVGDAIEYPFEHAREGVTLARFALPAVLPAKEEVGRLMDASGEAIERLVGLYRRALGRLAVTAEEVEKALGLPPIAVDDPDDAAA